MSDDPRVVWRDQAKEALPVHIAQIVARRTEELSSGSRSEILASVGAALLFVAVIAWRFGPEQSRLLQIGYAAVIAWVLATLYWFRRRLWVQQAPPPDAIAATGLEYYRTQLERRRDHLRNGWIWHGPLVLACGMLIVVLSRQAIYGNRRLLTAVPLFAVLAIWIGFSVVRRRRIAAELQREIDEIS